MYSYCSDNIHLPYPPTSRECPSKLECYLVISHHCTFCGGRTPHQMLWYTSIHATSLGNYALQRTASDYAKEYPEAQLTPTCANYALQRTASDNAKEYPEAAKAVHENFYMGDHLDSVESARGPSLGRRNRYIFSI